MKTPLSDPEKFDILNSFRKFSAKGGPMNLQSAEDRWEVKCRPILIKALIDYRTTSSVLEHLIEEGVPLGGKPENRLRTVQRWLARTREYLHLPRIPKGGKLSNPGYQEALRLWKSKNPIPADEDILGGWRAIPVDYTGINFLSNTDAYAPRIVKSPEIPVASPVSSKDPETGSTGRGLIDSPQVAFSSKTSLVSGSEASAGPKKKLRPSQMIGNPDDIDFDARVDPPPKEFKVIR